MMNRYGHCPCETDSLKGKSNVKQLLSIGWVSRGRQKMKHNFPGTFSLLHYSQLGNCMVGIHLHKAKLNWGRAHCTDGHLLHWESLFNILLFISILKIPISIIRLELFENVKKFQSISTLLTLRGSSRKFLACLDNKPEHWWAGWKQMAPFTVY